MRILNVVQLPGGSRPPGLQENMEPGEGIVSAIMYRRDRLSGLFIPVEYSRAHNVRILAARAKIAEILIEGDAAQGIGIRDVATGDGKTVPAQTDSALANELDRGVGSWDKSGLGDSVPTSSVSYQFQPAEANGNNTEAGLFFDNGDMVARARYGSGDITAATKASPCVITSAGHGLTGGDSFTDPEKIYIQSVGGMTQLNGNYYYVKYVSSSQFSLYTDVGLSSPVDSSSYGTYTSGGEWLRTYTKTSSEILITTWTLSW